jgi:hypothetical protein
MLACLVLTCDAAAAAAQPAVPDAAAAMMEAAHVLQQHRLHLLLDLQPRQPFPAAASAAGANTANMHLHCPAWLPAALPAAAQLATDS